MTTEATHQVDEDTAAPDGAAEEEAAAWAEFDAEEAKGGDATGPSDTDRQDAVHDEENGSEAETEADTSAAPETDGDAKVGTDTDKGEAPDGDKSSGSDADKDQADIWANATPEQRAAYEAARKDNEKLLHENKSHRGRLSALQSRINRAQPTVPRESSPGAESQSAKRAENFLESDDWKTFKEEYGEVAAPIGAAFEQVLGTVKTLESQLSAINTDRRQDAVADQEAVLDQDHADWRDVVADNETAFVDWVNAQPRHIKEAAIRNQSEIVDAAEAADVISRFKAHIDWKPKEDSPGEGDGQTDADEGRETGDGNQADQLSGKRQRQLEAGTGTRTKGISVSNGIPEEGDPDKIWAQMDKAGL